MANNYDYSRIDPINYVDISLVDPQIRIYANFIRRKFYGKDVRESIARTQEWQSALTAKYLAKVNSATDLMNYMQNEFENTLNGLTQDSEVKDARMNAKGEIFKTLKVRLDNQEEKIGTMGPTIKTIDNKIMMKINGLTTTSKGLHYNEIDSKNDQRFLNGFYTKNVGQITMKEFYVNG